MKTPRIEVELLKHFDFTQNLVVNNVTTRSRLVNFETDLLVLSKSGYAHGVEIKVSKSDFKNDFKKPHIKTLDMERYFKNLKFFSYAFPSKLLEFAQKNVDERFGLYSISYHETYDSKWYEVDMVRKPKMLFNKKWSDRDRMHLAHLGCMRIFNSKLKEL